MTANVLRCTIVTTALAIAATVAVDAQAQCCGATTAFYQPTAVTAYSPIVVQPVQTGWYPGYFLDRIRTRLWGAPSTYVASYPTTYVASYPSTYAASYPSTHVASYPTYTASYATSYAPVASCATCPTQQVTMRPVVSCDPCSACGTSGVMQTSYVESSGCASCGVGSYNGNAGTTIVVPNGTVVTPGAQQNGTSQPTLAPGETASPERSLKVPAEGTEPPPAGESNESSPEETTTEGATGTNANYFEAPQLFDPKDRTAQRKISPVRTALYQQAASYRGVSASSQKITAEQAQRDAIGWTSTAN